MLVQDISALPHQTDRDLLCYLFMSGIHHKGNPIRNIVVSNKHSVSETILLQDPKRILFNTTDAGKYTDTMEYLLIPKYAVENAMDLCNLERGRKLFKRVWGKTREPLTTWAGKYLLANFINFIILFCWGALYNDQAHNPFAIKYLALATIFSLLFIVLTFVVVLGYMLFGMIGYSSCWGTTIRPRSRPFIVRMILSLLLTFLTCFIISPLGLWVIFTQGL